MLNEKQEARIKLCPKLVLCFHVLHFGACGDLVVKALYNKPAGRGFDSRWCHWNSSVTRSLRSHHGPGVDSASNRNEYQEYFLGGKGGRCVRISTFLPSCTDCLEIYEPQPPGTLNACPGLDRIVLPWHYGWNLVPNVLHLLRFYTNKWINIFPSSVRSISIMRFQEGWNDV